MTGDIAEAERIARLLREEFAQDFKDGKFTTDVTAFKTLTERTALVSKWDAIVEDLKAPEHHHCDRRAAHRDDRHGRR